MSDVLYITISNKCNEILDGTHGELLLYVKIML